MINFKYTHRTSSMRDCSFFLFAVAFVVTSFATNDRSRFCRYVAYRFVHVCVFRLFFCLVDNERETKHTKITPQSMYDPLDKLQPLQINLPEKNKPQLHFEICTTLLPCHIPPHTL